MHKFLGLGIGFYSLCLIASGILAYVRAHSLVSFLMASIFGLSLSMTAILLFKKNTYGFYLTVALCSLLDCVFIIRSLKTGAFFPSMMAIITAVILITTLSLKKYILN